MNRARDLEACAHGRGCCQLWLREGVAKGSGLASAVAASARGTLGDGVAVCRTRRVVSFGLIGRFLYVRWESGRTRLRVCLDDGAPAGHDLAVSQASPCKVSGARYRGSEEGTAFQRSYLSVQHAALVPRCVGRHQCPHPCFLPAAPRSDSGSFAAERCARDAAAGRRCVFQLATSYA